jgi:aminoglycoside phosphotransferase family enzyme/predicted kinase
MPEPQQPVLDFLADPSSYGLAPDCRVERIDTHCASVFLAGERAFKLKRAIRFAYLDFSTLALREEFCRTELAINRRTAPGIYLGLHRITRETGGKLAFDGTGDLLDWVIEMRRFEQSALFDRMADEGRLTIPLMQELADIIWHFHRSLTPVHEPHGAARFAQVMTGNFGELQRAGADGILDLATIDRLRALGESALNTVAALLDRRAGAGKVRRCHGDLHLRNICLWEGRPTLFDAIEFSEELATIDLLYDLAFLLMDLEYRGARDLANRVLNRYLDRGEEEDGLAALRLFMAIRAVIRAHVSASTARRHGESAAGRSSREQSRRYLDLALRLLQPANPRLIAIGGFSGTGKSTLAYHLAPELGSAPGARVLRSDVIRKRLQGVPPETKLPPEAYRAEVTRQVYDTLMRESGQALAAGATVIADAVFSDPTERAAIERIARGASVGFTGLWLEAPAAILEARIRDRRSDASDADVAVLRRQLERPTGPMTWHRVDAAGVFADAVANARRALASLPP